MPIYEYICRQCGKELEKLQRLSDPALTDCPACGASALVKKVSAAGFRLKGGGWYETDFKSDGKKNLAGDKKPDSGKTDGTDKGAGKTDTSAPKTDSATSKPTTPAAGKAAQT